MQTTSTKLKVGKIFLCVLAFNLITLVVLVGYYSGGGGVTDKAAFVEDYNSDTFLKLKNEIPYKFDNPALAQKILNELDKFDPLPQWAMENMSMNRKFLGVTRDDNYCEKSRKFFTEHAEVLFGVRNVFTDHTYQSIARGKALPLVATDVHPEIHRGMRRTFQANRDLYVLKNEIGVYFLNGGMHNSYFINKQFDCNHQTYSHIHGATELNRKSNLAINYQTYVQSYKDKPQCQPDFMPDSYMLKNVTQCQQFFAYLATDKYKQEKEKFKYVFFKKIGRGAHRGEGVYLFDDREEEMLKRDLDNGNLCATRSRDLQMQRYIANPLLLEGHKFDFRVYMLIVSTKPLIVYYHDGFAKLSMHIYERNSTDRGVHLSNTEMSKEIFHQAQNGGYMGMNETEVRKFQTWMYYRLQDYLLKTNQTNDTEWVENGLRKQMMTQIMHVARMCQHGFLKRPNMYELYGVDFILDEDLKLWFIEANTSPMMEATTAEREQLLIDMLSSHFELMFSFLRSRMKRVITFVNQLTKTMTANTSTSGEFSIPNFAQVKMEYDELINQNYLDPEFALSKKNGFRLCVDESKNGTERYGGLLKEECF
jgi:hypothetical protein